MPLRRARGELRCCSGEDPGKPDRVRTLVRPSSSLRAEGAASRMADSQRSSKPTGTRPGRATRSLSGGSRPTRRPRYAPPPGGRRVLCLAGAMSAVVDGQSACRAGGAAGSLVRIIRVLERNVDGSPQDDMRAPTEQCTSLAIKVCGRRRPRARRPSLRVRRGATRQRWPSMSSAS